MIFIAVCIHLVILAFDCAVTNPCRDSTGGSPLSHNKSEPSSEVQPSSTLEQTPPHGPSTSVCYLCACLGSEIESTSSEIVKQCWCSLVVVICARENKKQLLVSCKSDLFVHHKPPHYVDFVLLLTKLLLHHVILPFSLN